MASVEEKVESSTLSGILPREKLFTGGLENRLKRELTKIAHNKYEGRESGSDVYEKEFLPAFENRLRKIGLQPLGELKELRQPFHFTERFFKDFARPDGTPFKYGRLVPAGTPNSKTTANIIGVVPGTDHALENEFVVVVSHLDGLGKLTNGKDQILNGANDNATGVVVGEEAARHLIALGKNNLGQKRAVIFLFTSAEELGHVGAQYFISRLPLAKDQKIVAAINLEMLGDPGANPDRISVLNQNLRKKGEPICRTELLNLVKNDNLFSKSPNYLPDDLLLRGDHAPFLSKGIPTLTLSGSGVFTSTEGLQLPKNYHQSDDESKSINYKYLGQAAVYATRLIYSVSNAAREDLDRRSCKEQQK